jgi:hypothetical protein
MQPPEPPRLTTPRRESRLSHVDEAQRTAQREVISKDVNDKLVEGLGIEADGTVSVLCECGSDGCDEWLSVSAQDYAATQDDDTLFVVAVGHERPEFERIVERNTAYLVIEKVGRAGEEADRLDDREET